ncbi:hypothetical protein Cgig2_021192 [Carnegiea gigantea]|uniref:Peptidase A2 domain-containing protein n=1 Tax=Carnegiea gigantea TaxID=171969 RepID=A0A9Q1QSI5_9CARY|nr:hypothetical protein Cgig2_021192 [Carnegiea gigantea]
MMFGGKDSPRFTSPHNDPLVVEMKITSAIMRRIQVDTGSFVDIITWDCLKKFVVPGRDIVPMTNPILGFGGQEVYPSGMIRLPVCFGDKTGFKSLEVDFLVVDVPTAYNVKGVGGLLVGLFATLTTFLLGRAGLSFQRICGLVLNSFTLRRRGDKLHLFWIAALHGNLLTFVHEAQVGLIIFVVPEFGCKGKQNLAEVDEGVRAALLITLLPGLSHISRSFLQLTLHLFFTALHVRLELFIAPLVPRNKSLQPPAFCGSLHPPGKTLSHEHLLLGHLRGV